jgi:putative Mg2+ transporter-C (MgtC) family protein
VAAVTIPADDQDAVLRLLAACAAGMLIGANRGLSGKPTGMRTLGLVCLGAALVTIVTIRVPGMQANTDALSRVLQGVIQGVLTGIGFIGAGVVLRRREAGRVEGLTTAAAVWITAALGIACALASWTMVAVAIVVALTLLIVVRPIDRLIERSGQDDADREE